MEWVKRGRRLGASQRLRGTTLVEAALVLSILVMVTLGTIKYGWLFFRVHQTTNAAREGARRAILPGATLPEVTTAVETVMARAGMSLATVGYTVVLTPPDPAGVAPGSEIMVHIAVPTANVDIIRGYLPAPANLIGSVTMAKEG